MSLHQGVSEPLHPHAIGLLPGQEATEAFADRKCRECGHRCKVTMGGWGFNGVKVKKNTIIICGGYALNNASAIIIKKNKGSKCR